MNQSESAKVKSLADFDYAGGIWNELHSRLIYIIIVFNSVDGFEALTNISLEPLGNLPFRIDLCLFASLS